LDKSFKLYREQTFYIFRKRRCSNDVNYFAYKDNLHEVLLTLQAVTISKIIITFQAMPAMRKVIVSWKPGPILNYVLNPADGLRRTAYRYMKGNISLSEEQKLIEFDYKRFREFPLTAVAHKEK
jgi:hypothetical protein